jgi:hypothetical protein
MPYHHRRHRAALAMLSTAVLVGLPATAAYAAQPPGPPPPLEDPYPGGGGDAVIYPQGYPVAVLEMPPLVRSGRTVELVLDDSTGDVVDQEFRIEDADGQLRLVVLPDCPPGPDCWLAFSLRTPGSYTATLTVTGPTGETTSDSHGFVVFQIRLPEL